MKRLVSLDWMRGSALASVVFFHALVFDMTPTTGSEDQDSAAYMVILYLIAWAGFFGMIPGWATASPCTASWCAGRSSAPPC